MAAIRRKLQRWYVANRRDLPWRRTRDPYAIWISEIMLQQTRVAAVIPYYERFLKRFPDPHELASAPEDEVLTLWAGLGYYSRARNLQKAARQVVERGGFPSDYESLLELVGVGSYTAAAIASIAFGLPHAVVDGNVKRVVARLTNDAEAPVQEVANSLLNRRDPGASNQALMELGATVCVPGVPLCSACPISSNCLAYEAGTAAELPPKKKKPASVKKTRRLLLIERQGRVLLAACPRVVGFWELPETEALHGASFDIHGKLGSFRHAITNSQYLFEVFNAKVTGTPDGCRWWKKADLGRIPLSTASKKAIRCLEQL